MGVYRKSKVVFKGVCPKKTYNTYNFRYSGQIKNKNTVNAYIFL